ncbi:MAG: hypothetical protein HDS79_05320 [Bacteroidales bacterium]|nr:hypothetical protein [Bacteroidales bacterium]
MRGYKKYRGRIITALWKEAARKNGKEMAPGCWKGVTKDSYKHILPLNGVKNTKEARRDAIQKYLGIKIDDMFLSKNGALHQYAHHLNSSQLLCYMAFRPLLTNDSKTKCYRPTEAFKKLFASQNINISECAQCEFEYNDHLMWKERNIPEVLHLISILRIIIMNISLKSNSRKMVLGRLKKMMNTYRSLMNFISIR